MMQFPKLYEAILNYEKETSLHHYKIAEPYASQHAKDVASVHYTREVYRMIREGISEKDIIAEYAC